MKKILLTATFLTITAFAAYQAPSEIEEAPISEMEESQAARREITQHIVERAEPPTIRELYEQYLNTQKKGPALSFEEYKERWEGLNP